MRKRPGFFARGELQIIKVQKILRGFSAREEFEMIKGENLLGFSPREELGMIKVQKIAGFFP